MKHDRRPSRHPPPKHLPPDLRRNAGVPARFPVPFRGADPQDGLPRPGRLCASVDRPFRCRPARYPSGASFGSVRETDVRLRPATCQGRIASVRSFRPPVGGGWSHAEDDGHFDVILFLRSLFLSRFGTPIPSPSALTGTFVLRQAVRPCVSAFPLSQDSGREEALARPDAVRRCPFASRPACPRFPMAPPHVRARAGVEVQGRKKNPFPLQTAPPPRADGGKEFGIFPNRTLARAFPMMAFLAFAGEACRFPDTFLFGRI